MERRKFLKIVAGMSAIALCSCTENAGKTQARQGDKMLMAGRDTEVYLASVNRGASEQEIKSAVCAAAEAATDFSWLSRGDSVFIKPVLNSGYPYPATTSPTAVGAMVELLKKKGAQRVIVGDMSGIGHVKLTQQGFTGSTRRLMEAAGMTRIVQAAGAEIHFFEEAGWDAFYEDIPSIGSHWKRGLMMPAILRKVDHIILMPRCGRHVLTGGTLGLKAAVGYWRTDTRLEYHHDAHTLHEKTGEGNTVETLGNKQRLVLTAADKILTTFGPDRGQVYEPENGLIIAAESVIAHDMVSLAWLLDNRRHIYPSDIDDFVDSSQLVAGIGNRWVVGQLGGWRPVLSSERLTKNKLKTIWDDLVLNHAYRVFGGVPKVILKAANGALREDLKKRLSEMTAFSAG
ncbi:MAG TPA: DUF362 domain-containing protein [Syntrophales bacterium]|nr:DUF362 domain-containing protein [Syntrophales bacterium]